MISLGKIMSDIAAEESLSGKVKFGISNPT